MLPIDFGKIMGSWQILVINTENGFKAEGRGQKAEVRKKEEVRRI